MPGSSDPSGQSQKLSLTWLGKEEERGCVVVVHGMKWEEENT